MILVVTSYLGQNWRQNTFEPVQKYDCLKPWSLYEVVWESEKSWSGTFLYLFNPVIECLHFIDKLDGFLNFFGTLTIYLYLVACILLWKILGILIKFLGLLVRILYHFHLELLQIPLYISYEVRVQLWYSLVVFIGSHVYLKCTIETWLPNNHLLFSCGRWYYKLSPS